MIRRLARSAVVPVLIPAMLLSAAYLLVPRVPDLPRSIAGIVDYGPTVLLLLQLILASVFNRGKLVLTSLLLLAGISLHGQRLAIGTLSMEQASIVEFALGGLVPFNLAIVMLLPERGVLSAHQWLRFGLLVLEILLFFVVFTYPDWVSLVVPENLRMQWLNAPFLAPLIGASGPLASLAQTHATLSLIALALLSVPLSLLRHRDNLTVGLAWALTGYVCAVLTGSGSPLFALNMMAIALLLAVVLIGDSLKMAYRDELTGLPQRRALREHLMALGSSYTLAMLDVDHFKSFNDRYGHDVGDQVLQMIARQLEPVGSGGSVYRYGGEEFSLVFAGKHLDEVLPVLEALRSAIEDYAMVIRDSARPEASDPAARKRRVKGSFREARTRVSVTVSIGAAMRETRDETPEDVLKRADEALYAAKKGGRNRVSV